MLRTVEERRGYGKEKHFGDVVAAFRHLRNQHVEESCEDCNPLEPDKPGLDS